ncbi:MAG: TAT-variant-translocated molybdopterin oxidoreductase [Opitutaceae bacterium]|nr:TAT-variant-translocated molybdopterin oxidoreductase [Opitutaceae bacterium]
MKREFQHPEPSERELSGPRYWRSLDELAATPGFQEQVAREFPAGASELNGVDRRHFFKIMAASFALGGVGLASGCRRPEEKILPYGKSVEGVIPGLPLYFATAMPAKGGAIPLLAETHQGRPTKLEGNPSYAPYGGATTILAQASILDLYDPDRSTTHTVKGSAVDAAAINEVLTGISRSYGTNGGGGLAFLVDESTSPTRSALVSKLRARYPRALWSTYEPVSNEVPVQAGRAVFGSDVKPIYHFERASRIVAIDSDIFNNESHSLAYARDYARGRRMTKPTDRMNRLYAVESNLTVTGSLADHRLRLATSHMLGFVAALAQAVTGDSTFAPLAAGIDFKEKDKWLTALAKDLNEHRGSCAVVAGPHLPVAVHSIVHALNAALGNIGSTVDFVSVPSQGEGIVPIAELVSAMKGGNVRTLVIVNGNPVYNAPANLGFGDALKNVANVIRYGYYADETSQASSTHVAAAHYLESWGDARTADGTVVPIQPQILPLFGGMTDIELFARLANETTTDPHALVQATISRLAGDGAFRRFLHDGVLAGSAYPVASVRLNSGGLRNTINAANYAPAVFSKDSLEVRFVGDAKVDDGRYANNGWLQECPDPISKIAWDNAILVSPRLGKELGIEPGSALLQVARKQAAEFVQGKEMAFVGKVTVGERTVEGPMHIQPGLSDYTIILPLGYGRKVSGRIGSKTGQDFYPLRTTSAATVAAGGKIEVTPRRYALANTQEHWSMEGRDIVREANLDEFARDPDWVNSIGMESHAPANLGKDKNLPLAAIAAGTPRGNSLYESPDYKGVHQWGMSIDLNTCTGCNACVIACQAENNIPIVGKQQVLRGREMHWIRLDRYYSDGRADAAAFGGEGNKVIPEDPQVVVQPVACQHCELAPCETVCPVNATVHDDEGLNVMAYNRCIGTRYCANNCPYKVRRFNFFDWNKRSIDELYMGPLGRSGMPELVKMVKNPEVSVRMRGVMEKCTYCVQRIEHAKILQKVKAGASSRVEIPDGTVKTACQQVCPVDAIVFGNIKDPNSAVSKAKAREQDYAVLGYLNIRPRTTYLGRFRNPNPEMPDYVSLPLSRKEYEAKNHPAHDEHGHGEQKQSHGHGAIPPDGSNTGPKLGGKGSNTSFGGLS